MLPVPSTKKTKASIIHGREAYLPRGVRRTPLAEFLFLYKSGNWEQGFDLGSGWYSAGDDIASTDHL